ncbi:TIGR04282 family arsenosugar biosynthesis glycosyltransferase [Hymenobacter sp. BT635]|uniref:TIGR04282 family arsenosugar biosynthesis glycosyltransferase n=1 Tax=Hymenobacter nitidus TaxID=2880929 RepID=A0ABS8A8G4_9BACT|nr:TIGR04282 family arsenosugar biosynthesis glycosyltransferase [Hymenobacter nitidus]MCB2376695.1 TIGR04282 family arsenosugar biosynthesis glycosyltransferase [Hymenobacter nitidus]
MNQHLLVFARQPELGRVKTRLARTIGDGAALAVYEELLAHTHAVTAELPVRRLVWLAEEKPGGAAPFWPGYEEHIQSGLDLGARMQAAFAYSFGQGATAAVIIGTDCPTLSAGHVREAFAALRTHEVVVGPAADGGYYLLGMQRLQPAFFQNKTWSTDSVLAELLADARQLNLRVHQLPVLRDVDTEEDLQAWRAVE